MIAKTLSRPKCKVTFPTSCGAHPHILRNCQWIEWRTEIDRSHHQAKSFTEQFSDSMRECLLTSGFSNCSVTRILLTVPPPLHTSFFTPEFFPKNKKKMTLRRHWKQCQNFSEGQTFSKGLPGSTHPAVFSLWVCDVQTVGASSWCQKPAWNMANVFFLPNSQNSVLHRVDAFPFMYVQNTFAFSFFPVGPHSFYDIQFSKHLLSPYCVRGTLPILPFCAWISHHINIIALLEVKACVKKMLVRSIYCF